ncbi:MAG: UDP-2,3-diacylglucosamine diphosphatase [Desulfuromonadales bacterium]|jgi:UDP-2,3-diacylglucosamine hydrolase
MRAIFVADAHLRKPGDRNYLRMLDFLEEQRGKTDMLVLLGDIFEFWIGKSTVIADHVPLIDALERLHQQGTQLVYVEGNHDFHLGPVFTERLACRVFPDGGSIELDGMKVYLAHGDLANPDDAGYRRLRSFFRSDLVRFLIRVLPSVMLQSIAVLAGSLSKKSLGGQRDRPAREVLKPYAETLLAAGHQAVVSGHFHQPFHEKLGDGELIALGDWITQFSYAVYENRTFTLASYRATTSADATIP